MKIIITYEKEYEVNVLSCYQDGFYRYYLIEYASDSERRLFVVEADLDDFQYYDNENDVIQAFENRINDFMKGKIEKEFIGPDYICEVETESEFDVMGSKWKKIKKPFELYQD